MADRHTTFICSKRRIFLLAKYVRDAATVLSCTCLLHRENPIDIDFTLAILLSSPAHYCWMQSEKRWAFRKCSWQVGKQRVEGASTVRKVDMINIVVTLSSSNNDRTLGVLA